MLNREKCRLILGDDLNLGDDELDRLRHQLRALAQVAISSAQRHDSRGNAPSSSLGLGDVPEEHRCAVEERAAILEFDAGIGREEAERLACLEHFTRDSNDKQDLARQSSRCHLL